MIRCIFTFFVVILQPLILKKTKVEWVLEEWKIGLW